MLQWRRKPARAAWVTVFGPDWRAWPFPTESWFVFLCLCIPCKRFAGCVAALIPPHCRPSPSHTPSFSPNALPHTLSLSLSQISLSLTHSLLPLSHSRSLTLSLWLALTLSHSLTVSQWSSDSVRVLMKAGEAMASISRWTCAFQTPRLPSLSTQRFIWGPTPCQLLRVPASLEG